MLVPRLAVVARDEQVRLEIVARDGRRPRRTPCRRRSATRRCARSSTDVIRRGRPGMFLPTSVNVAPPSRLTCTLPSSVPAQTTPGSTGDSETEMIVL